MGSDVDIKKIVCCIFFYSLSNVYISMKQVVNITWDMIHSWNVITHKSLNSIIWQQSRVCLHYLNLKSKGRLTKNYTSRHVRKRGGGGTIPLSAKKYLKKKEYEYLNIKKIIVIVLFSYCPAVAWTYLKYFV